jgi:hypothetical protein
MKRTVILALLVTFAALAGAAGAQTLTGTLTGKVSDEQGGVLPGVTVTLTGPRGSQTQVSDSKGEFRFIGLTPGAYAVKAELQGFRPKEQQNLDVSLGRTLDVPLTMTVGGLSETVDVVADSVMIDTTTTATDTGMSQDLLFSMPISHNNPGPNIVNYSPGVNDGSAFGGASDGGNALMLDGVDTRDPEGGTSWVFYNYNIIDEIQVGSLGQPAEYGSFTGAVVNTVTKSGGNRFSFLSEYRYTSEDLAGDNVTSEIIKGNPTLAVPNRVLSMNDYTVQLGGPLKKDKIFFHGSIQRYQIKQKVSGAIREEKSPRFNGKFTFQPTPTDNIIASVQYDQYNQKGRTGFIPAYAVTSNSQTIDQDSPEAVWNAQYRKTFGASTLFEAKFVGYWGYYDLNPVSPEPTHYDGETGAYSGGAGYTNQYDRTRNQLNLGLSKYAQMAGTHNFKFGAEIERSNIRDRSVYSGASAAVPTGVFYYDYGGPYIAYGYAYDLQGKNKRESYFAQDAWKMGRVTLNLGVRVDHVTGDDKTTGKQLYSTFSVAPRLGLAYDVTGKGLSVLRAFYGQMYEGAFFSSWSRATEGLTPTMYYDVHADGSLTKYDEVARKYSVSNNIDHPRVNEFNVAWEQQFARQFKFTATGIWREWKNFINSTLESGRWTPFAYTPPAWAGPGSSPIPSAPVTLYKWDNPTSVPEFTIGNTDRVSYTMTTGQTQSADAYRNYKGMMLVLQKIYRNRWQAQVSYVLSSTKGTVGNSTYAGISSGQFETPNTILVNADGPTAYDRRHEVKVFAGYQIPKIEVSVNGYFRYLSGWPYPAVRRFGAGNSTLGGWPSAITPNLDAPDAHMNDSGTNLDLRLEKVFNAGIHRFGVYLDLQNALNQITVNSRQSRYPNRALTMPSAYAGNGLDLEAGESVDVWFGDALTVSTARQLTFGLRWSF